MTNSWLVRVLLGVFFLATPLHLIRPIVSYRALELGASTGQIGFIAASYAILSLVVAIPTGQWVDRIGETWFILLGALVLAAMALWLASSAQLLALAVAQAILGAGQVFSMVALQTLVANYSRSTERDARFGFFSVVGSLGQVVGPALGGVIASSVAGGTRAALLTGGIFLIGLLIVGASIGAWPPPASERRSTPRDWHEQTLPAMIRVLRMRSMPQAIIASMTVLAAVDILVAYVPVYGEANGISVALVGLLLSARAAASGLSRLVMMPLLRAFGRRRLFILGLGLAAITLLIFPWSPTVPVAFALMAGAGFGLGLGQPMSLSWVTTVAPSDARGMAVGVRLTGNRAGQVALPALVGAIGGASGVTWIFVSCAVMLAGSVAVVSTADFGGQPPAAEP